MYLRKIVERQKILDELERQGFTESREGISLKELSFQDLETEYVRLPELKEVRS